MEEKMNNTKEDKIFYMELFCDEVHDIIRRSSLKFQLFCFSWLLLVFSIIVISLILVKVPVKQDVVQGKQTVLIEKKIPLYKLFLLESSKR